MCRWIAIFRAAAPGISLCLGACSLYGPEVTRSSHLAYNEAVQASEQHELLLNIVRLRYLDAPEFLAINSISTQMRIEAQASLLGQFGDADGNRLATVAPGASAGYSESPVVTFTPQHDEDFTRQLVAPAALDSIYLLSRYGWGLERVLMLTAENINGLDNDVPREDTAAPHLESMQKFQALCLALRELDADNLIDIDVIDRWDALSAPIPAGKVSSDDLIAAAVEGLRFASSPETNALVLEKSSQQYVLRLHPEAVGTAALATLRQLAGLQTGRESYDMDAHASADPAGDRSLRIRTRSVLGTMAWLSRGVDAPAAHVASGLITPGDGLASLVGQWLVVHHAEEAPSSAWLAVPHRGYWFYVQGNDLNSRRTFGLLTSLIRLEIGAGGAQNVPVLTLPVSR